MYKQSLFDVEVGDEVACIHHYMGSNYWIKRKVKRVTKAQIVVNNQNDNPIKYWKKNGEEVEIICWKNVNVGLKGAILASEGVTKTITTTKENGEKVEARSENVKVDADGEVV